MKCVITGVTGFVGRYLADHLLQAGEAVLGCSQDGHWHAAATDPVRPEVELVRWDLQHQPDAESARRIRRFAPDCVFHLAAISNPRACGQQRPSLLANAVNVTGTSRVLALAESLQPSPRVLFCSSAHVYAPVPEHSPVVDEHAPLQPTSTYGQTKLQAEELCHQAARRGLRVIVVRPFPHTGPGQRPDFMLPAWTHQLTASEADPVRVITLDCHLDLCDVRDVVAAYRQLARAQAVGVFNVGSGQQVSGRRVMEQLQDAAGTRRAVVETRPGRRQHPIANIDRLVRATGWQPRIPLRQTIADSLQYWQGTLGTDAR